MASTNILKINGTAIDAANATAAASATTAVNVYVADASGVNSTYYIAFADHYGMNSNVFADYTRLTYNPSTGILNATASSAQTAYAVGTLTQNVTINGNLQVIGTSSFSYSTASIVQVGSSVINLNTNNPATRFGGITVVDSGSFGNSSTGSLFWDSLNNRWIYSNPSGSSYDGGMLMNGPRNTSGLGNEQGTTLNALMKGQGGDHITSSGIFEDGTLISMYSTMYVSSSGYTQIKGTTAISGSLLVTASADSATIGQFVGAKDGFIEFSVRNISASLSASTDIAAYADNGTTTSNYVDLGINSSIYGGAAYDGIYLGKRNDAYLFNDGGDFFIGNANNTSPSRSLFLFAHPQGGSTGLGLTITGSLLGVNKTGSLNANLDISGSVMVSGAMSGVVVSASIASNTASLDLNLGNFFYVQITNNTTTHINPINIKPGQTVNVRIQQAAGAAGAVSWPSTVKQPSGSAYSISTTLSAYDIVSLISFDSSALYLSYVKKLV